MKVPRRLKEPRVFNTTFATYTATRIVGEGGSGYILGANDEEGDPHAIKWLDPARATREKVRRFKNELLFCSGNRHPHILTVVDHGVFFKEGCSSPFYVMPLYDGSLRDLLRDGIPPHKALIYFAQILDGVEAAHLQGVAHRDLKPENILHSAQDDRLVIADFGIAHFTQDELYTAVVTKDSTRLANFQYAAPEQRSRGAQSDQRADIYALGLILNEMFTGTVPSGTGYRTIADAALEYEYLDGIVEEMLRQSPEARIGTIEQVKNQLIGRRNAFIVAQELSALKATVIPVTEQDDPLTLDPPRLVHFDWTQGKLTLFFQQPLNETWVWALQNMGSHSAVLGKGPESFRIQANTAIISADEGEVQRIIDHFNDWLPKANRVYEQRIRREREEAEKERRKQLEQQISEQEARQRVLRNTRLTK